VHRGEGWNFDIPIPEGAQKIRLITGDSGDSNAADHADWVDCGFVKWKIQDQGGARTVPEPEQMVRL
jgi:hypothetical protein